MAIGGSKREAPQGGDFPKKVGLFEGRVIAINPTVEQYKDILGIELKDDSKATEYLGESEDGNTTLRLSFWLEEVETKMNFNVSFFLENKPRMNKDGNKQQFINNYGSLCWAEDEDSLPDWFTKTIKVPNQVFEAHPGEEELYEFLKIWLPVDLTATDGELYLDWKKLMRGNIKELTSQINGDLAQNVLCLATINVKDSNGETKEYQSVFNRAFLYTSYMKNFRSGMYEDKKVIDNLKAKKPKDLKLHEKFVLKIAGEYGCKHYYVLKPLEDYDPEKNLVASDKVIDEDGADY